MKAIGFTRNLPVEHPEALLDLTLDDPIHGPRDLLVRVRAVSVNPVDHKVRQNRRPADGKAEAVGVNGLLLRVGRTDGVTSAGQVEVSVDYGAFRTQVKLASGEVVDAVVKIYPGEDAAKFNREVVGAQAAAATGMGPEFYGQVSIPIRFNLG